MAIRHLKHKYLIKEQFLEENELITSDFSFSRISDFLLLWWGFLLFGFIQISQMHDGNIIILFPFFFFSFLVRNPDCGGMPTWWWCRLFWQGFFGSKVVQIVPVKRKGFTQIWTVLIFLAQSGSGCPSWRKRYELDWTVLGWWRILLSGNVPLDINRG